ncbi:hypothetical protein ACWGJ2_09050 [Streptomyces sp. NPDC054796]
MPKSVVVGAVVCAVVLAGIAGCGGDGESGGKDHAGSSRKAEDSPSAGSGADAGDTAEQRLADRAVKAMKSAPSMKAKGGIAAGGQQRVTFDMALTRSGECTGDAGVGGGSAEVRKKGASSYLKADDAFWKVLGQSGGEGGQAASAAGDLLKGRWLKVPRGAMAQGGATEQDGGSSSPVEDPTAFCTLSALLTELDASDMKGAKKGALTKVGGEPAIPLTVKKNGATRTTYIAAEGEPYILKTEKKGGEAPGTVTFSGFGDPVDVTTPPPGETVDVGQLLKSGAF